MQLQDILSRFGVPVNKSRFVSAYVVLLSNHLKEPPPSGQAIWLAQWLPQHLQVAAAYHAIEVGRFCLLQLSSSPEHSLPDVLDMTWLFVCAGWWFEGKLKGKPPRSFVGGDEISKHTH